MNKGKMISIRLSGLELEKLERDSAIAGMDHSKYLRELILKNTPKEDHGKQKMACQICRLYKVISEERLEHNESLMKEVEALCQILY